VLLDVEQLTPHLGEPVSVQLRLDFRIELAWMETQPDGRIAMRLRCTAPDRDSGERTQFELNASWHPTAFVGDVATRKGILAEMIRTQLLELVVHEVDEGIVIDGRRPFDPHRGET
jgi:hypothetical protein